MKIWLGRLIQLAIGLAIVGGTGWYYWHNRQSGGLVRTSWKSSDPHVLAETVREVMLDDILESLGTARARESVDITATLTERIVRLNFDDGQVVKRGDLLAQLEDSQVLAEKRQAEINLAEQEREFVRIKRLLLKQAAAAKEHDEQQTRLQAAKALVDILDSKLSDRRLVAPFDGILGLRRVSEGDLVSPGTVLTTLDDIGIIKVDFNVPEKYLASLAKGLPFQADSAAYPGVTFNGRILAVGVRVDPVTRTASVRGEIPNPESRLMPGMLLNVRLRLKQRPAVVIPERALLSLGEEHYVFVLAPGARTVMRRVVRLGDRQRGTVEVTDGLKAGERLVVDGVNKLNDGAAIVIGGKADGGRP